MGAVLFTIGWRLFECAVCTAVPTVATLHNKNSNAKLPCKLL